MKLEGWVKLFSMAFLFIITVEVLILCLLL